MAGKTDLDEAKAAMIAETAEEIFLLPVFGFFAEKDKEKQVCICICFLLLRRQNLVSGKNILEISITMEVFFSVCSSEKIRRRNYAKHDDKAGKPGRRERIFCW